MKPTPPELTRARVLAGVAVPVWGELQDDIGTTLQFHRHGDALVITTPRGDAARLGPTTLRTVAQVLVDAADDIEATP